MKHIRSTNSRNCASLEIKVQTATTKLKEIIETRKNSLSDRKKFNRAHERNKANRETTFIGWSTYVDGWHKNVGMVTMTTVSWPIWVTTK